MSKYSEKISALIFEMWFCSVRRQLISVNGGETNDKSWGSGIDGSHQAICEHHVPKQPEAGLLWAKNDHAWRWSSLLSIHANEQANERNYEKQQSRQEQERISD